MTAPQVSPLVQRTLSVVYRFYDAFLYPLTESTPAIGSALDVSIPTLEWSAQRAETDLTYRFSALTLAHAAPGGTNLAVHVTSARGDYVSWEPILVTLPLPIPSPPTASAFLRPTPLWPTTTLRPPAGETAVRGRISSPTAQTVSRLKVQLWQGSATSPPAGTPFTFTNTGGEFLYRFPLIKGAPRSIVSTRIWLDDNAVPASPSAFNVVLGQTQIVEFQRN